MKTVLVIFSIMASVVGGCSQNSKKLQTADYTNEQWMEMITRQEHQPIPIWNGVSVGTIEENGSSAGGGGLMFNRTPAGVLESQAPDLLKKDPLMFLPALASKDQRVLFTGIYLYVPDRFVLTRNLTDQQKQEISSAYRELLTNDNAIIRSIAIRQLAARSQLTVGDIQKGLSDRTHEVHFITAYYLYSIFDNAPVYTKEGKIYKGRPDDVIKLVQMKRQLAPVLLEHLNDPNPFTRSTIANVFHRMLKRVVHVGDRKTTTKRPPEYFLHRFDWQKESWYECREMKKIWKEWWAEHGEEALKFAHPPQS